jgi:hypothetical protein
MASGEVYSIGNVLSSDECSKIPEDIQKKIESYIKSTAEESLVAKALLETTKGNFGKYLCGEAVIGAVWRRMLHSSSNCFRIAAAAWLFVPVNCRCP